MQKQHSMGKPKGRGGGRSGEEGPAPRPTLSTPTTPTTHTTPTTDTTDTTHATPTRDRCRRQRGEGRGTLGGGGSEWGGVWFQAEATLRPPRLPAAAAGGGAHPGGGEGEEELLPDAARPTWTPTQTPQSGS